MAYEFYLCLDAKDYGNPATVSLLEKSRRGANDEADYFVRQLVRFDDDGSVDSIRARVARVLDDEPFNARTTVVINRSGKLGAEVLAALKESGLSANGVDVVADGPDGENERGVYVSEAVLMDSLADIYFSDRLHLPEAETPESAMLAEGLHVLLKHADDTGEVEIPNITPTERLAMHTNFAFSAALACWFAEHRISYPATVFT